MSKQIIVQINFNEEEIELLDEIIEKECLGKRTVYCKMQTMKSLKKACELQKNLDTTLSNL